MVSDTLEGSDHPREHDGAILIVDDERSIRSLLVRVAHKASRRRIAEASTVSEAVRLLETGGPFDAIICDVDLPDGLGWDIARQARALFPRASIVMMTGAAENAVHAKVLGLRLHLKPLNVGLLMLEVGISIGP